MSVSGEGSAAENVGAAKADLEQALTVSERLDRLEERAVWLDAEFRFPFTNRRIGVSSIVGLLPGFGDSVMMVLAATIVYHGMRLGAPTGTLIWMTVILIVEGLVSIVPIFGDFIGLIWSANIGNVGRLRAREESMDGSTNWLFALVLASPFILLVLAVVSLL